MANCSLRYDSMRPTCLGVAFTKAFSFRIGMADSSTCDSCGSEERIVHVLCSCAPYGDQLCPLRMILNQLHSRPFPVPKILEPWTCASREQKGTKPQLKYLNSTDRSERPVVCMCSP
uniref:Tick transposon n=1 Tax=Rhipicephalus appendiculatus TaxID=34631 RepID=A0A131YVW6_RHIAP